MQNHCFGKSKQASFLFQNCFHNTIHKLKHKLYFVCIKMKALFTERNVNNEKYKKIIKESSKGSLCFIMRSWREDKFNVCFNYTILIIIFVSIFWSC